VADVCLKVQISWLNSAVSMAYVM